MKKLHTETLNEPQIEILPKLASFTRAVDFYLGGGTAIALHLGHRGSVDFDFFTDKRLDDPLILVQNAKNYELTISNPRVSRGTLHAEINNINVSFFEYLYPLLEKPSTNNEMNLQLANLDDLACMKLTAIAQRGSCKDFIDIYAILTTHKSLSDLLSLYQKKYTIDEIGHVLVGLTYFDDADKEPLPRMIWDVKWEYIKESIIKWTKQIVM